MITKQITEAFAAYDATLVNPQWAISEIAEDGALVVCPWQKWLVPFPIGGSVLRYDDSFLRLGVNKLGEKRLRGHLRQAVDSALTVRVIIVSPDNSEHWKAIEAGKAARTFAKSFDVRKKWRGKVVLLTDERFVIDFETGTGNETS